MTNDPLAGQRIRVNRLRCGLTQAALANLIGINSTYLSLLESGGASPSRELAVALATAFSIEPDELCNISALRPRRAIRPPAADITC